MAWGLKVWALDSLLSTHVSLHAYFSTCLVRVTLSESHYQSHTLVYLQPDQTASYGA